MVHYSISLLLCFLVRAEQLNECLLSNIEQTLQHYNTAILGNLCADISCNVLFIAVAIIIVIVVFFQFERGRYGDNGYDSTLNASVIVLQKQIDDLRVDTTVAVQ